MSDGEEVTKVIASDRDDAKLLRDMLPSMAGEPDALMLVAALIASLEVNADTIERLQKELDFRREIDAASAGGVE